MHHIFNSKSYLIMHDMGEHMSCLISITKTKDALDIPLACSIHALGTPLGLTRCVASLLLPSAPIA